MKTYTVVVPQQTFSFTEEEIYDDPEASLDSPLLDDSENYAHSKMKYVITEKTEVKEYVITIPQQTHSFFTNIEYDAGELATEIEDFVKCEVVGVSYKEKEEK